MENLKWTPVKGYEGIYEITPCGQFRSLDRLSKNGSKLKGRIKKITKSPFSYPTVSMIKDGVTRCRGIHVLLAEHFIPNPEGKPEVNHIDGDKWNYRLDNLEWCTREENIRHAFDNDFRNPDHPVKIMEKKRHQEWIENGGVHKSRRSKNYRPFPEVEDES